jgi:ABC-2 type transport system ATP-binding protein
MTASLNDTGPGGAIEADGLAKRYGEVTAVAGVSFAVPAGQVFAYLGRNGSGKTTTVRMLTTLTRPTAGTARVAGYDVSDAGRVRSRIGVTLQEAALDPAMTAVQHLRLIGGLWGLSRRVAAARAAVVLETFGLGEAAHRRIGTFSGGMQRRLDIATALISEPPVLFLDEPTTGLDPQARRALWAHIRHLRDRGVTVFLTTQYLQEADELADRVAVIDDGEIIALDTPARLRAGFGRTRVTFAHDSAAGAVAAALPELSVADADGRATVELHVDGPDVVGVLDRVRAAGVEVRQLAVTEPTLEDVFLRLTGSDITIRQDLVTAGGPA